MGKPHRNVFDLIQGYFPEWTPKLMFDVGANRGQTATAYARRFPSAQIHSFEPVPLTHDKLVAATKEHPNVSTHNIGLGKHAETLTMQVNGSKPTNRVVTGADPNADNVIEVPVRPGADIFRELGAERIDYLKIDTEGHDLNVLLGFLPVIQDVDFIQVEAAMNPYNKTHVPLRAFEDLLWEHGFYLLHIFEQTMEWKRRGRPVLRRSNPVFINGRHVDIGRIS